MNDDSINVGDICVDLEFDSGYFFKILEIDHDRYKCLPLLDINNKLYSMEEYETSPERFAYKFKKINSPIFKLLC